MSKRTIIIAAICLIAFIAALFSAFNDKKAVVTEEDQEPEQEDQEPEQEDQEPEQKPEPKDNNLKVTNGNANATDTEKV